MSKRHHLFTMLVAVAVSAGAWAAGERGGTTEGARSGTTGQAVNDTWITTKVKTALLADQATSGLDVKVETQDGVVQLSGFVASETEKQRAEEIAGTIEGVKEIKNDLRLHTDRQ